MKFRKPKEKKCALCGLPFMANSPAAQYCSDQCRKETRTGYIAPRECEYCGLMFQPRTVTQKYCSREHGVKAYNITHRHCKQCNKIFVSRLSTAFCSDECCDEYFSCKVSRFDTDDIFKISSGDAILAEIEVRERFRDAINDYDNSNKW